MSARTILTAVAVVAAACIAAPAHADGDNHVNFLIGQKSFSDDDVDPLDSGATFAAALKVAADAPAGSVILAMLPDTGERYLSTPLFEGIADGSDPEA